jgi:hypothetical protein
MELELPVQPQGPTEEQERQAVEWVSEELELGGIDLPEDAATGFSQLFPVSGLTADAATLALSLEGTRPVFWRRFLFNGDEALAAVDYQAEGGGIAGSVRAIHRGKLVANSVEAIRKAEAESIEAVGPFEIRFLLVQSVYILALWLREVGGRKTHFFIPIPPAHHEFEFKLYEEEEFLEKLRAAAQLRLSFPNPL